MYVDAEGQRFRLIANLAHLEQHAIVLCRNQLANPNRVWLRFNPTWAAQVGEEALNHLRTFGYRQVWADVLDSDLVISPEEDKEYFESDLEAEEGFATEHQVSKGPSWTGQFGGIARYSQPPEDLVFLLGF